MMELAATRLRELLEYEPSTGVFKWRETGKGRRKDRVAGATAPSGYVSIGIDYDIHYAHRLAWFYVTGAWPACQIDHRNGVRGDNSFANLREATSAQNNANRQSRGYYWEASRAAWLVQISVGNRNRHVGRFESEAEAKRAYLHACESTRGKEWVGRQAA